jgi:hypothetical protein
VIAGCGSNSSSSSSSSSSSTSTSSATVGYEGIPLEQGPPLASGNTPQQAPVDGIQCGSTEQLAYHIHARLTVFVNGQRRTIPAGVGIPGAIVQTTSQGPVVGQGTCFYWLHTHTTDGVLHIESPTARIYTLGNFFDEWGQPLSANQVAAAKGKVTAFVNGKRWTKDPRLIPLQAHYVIQLDVGSPITPFQPISFASTQL